MTRSLPALFLSCVFAGFVLPVYSQTPYQPGDAQFEDGSAAAAQLIPAAAAPATAPASPSATGNIPSWQYSVVSPVDGRTYTGTMIGTSPFIRPAGTTEIRTILVPIILTLRNTTTGFTATFNPIARPDAGCTAGRTVVKLIEESPIFRNRDWTMNGVQVGDTQYIDAFQRANFWSALINDGHEYHVKLRRTVGDPLFLTVDYTTPTLSADVLVGLGGPCTNTTGPQNVNVGGYEAFVDLPTIDAAARGYIAARGITTDKFPIFILYNSVMPSGGNFFIAGYHSLTSFVPNGVGQTYAVAEFQTNPFFARPLIDTSILAHEIGEWMDDPTIGNGTPLWGNIGQVSGCQGNLEVGDPLTGTNLPDIDGPNGFQYHLQELAFFSWFFRTPSLGAGGLFSNNGTFTTDAGHPCP